MSQRGLLRIFAVLFGLLAVSNFLKPLQLGADVGFVLLGQRLSGTANLIAGPLFGAYLLTYAIAIWRQKRYALPMGRAYAAYVLANLILWNFRRPEGADSSLAFALTYMAIALGVSWGAAFLLARNRAALD